MSDDEPIKDNSDIKMENGIHSEEDIKVKKQKLVSELNKFLRTRTVYETVPENMKVNIYEFYV
jgi:hypothetical protein